MNPSVSAIAAALGAALPLPAVPAPDGPVVAAGLLPAQLPLPQQPGTAVVAKVGTRPGSQVVGEVCVVVAADLVEALRDSPLGELSVAAAVQPAIDAAAAAAGVDAEAGQELPVEVVSDTYRNRADALVVGLVDVVGEVVAAAFLDLAPGAARPLQELLAASPSVGAAPSDAGPAPAALPQLGVPAPRSGTGAGALRGLDLLRDVEMELTVELGRTRMAVRDLLSLAPGAVVELDRAAGSPADLLVNGTLIARGEVVVVDEDFGIRITEILSPGAERVSVRGRAGGGSAA